MIITILIYLIVIYLIYFIFITGGIDDKIEETTTMNDCPICGREDNEIFEACNECGYNPHN